MTEVQAQPRHRVLMAIAVLGLAASPAGAGGLDYRKNNSSVTYTHELIEGDQAHPFRTLTRTGNGIPKGYPGFKFPNVTLEEALDPKNPAALVLSGARTGIGHFENAFSGSTVVQPGTAITQVDESDLTDQFSALRIDFNLLWGVDPPRFGPPLLGHFTIPLSVNVGAGGAAEIEAEVNWIRRNMAQSGNPETELRPQFTTMMPFNESHNGLQSISVPPALFSPKRLRTTDRFIMRGHIILRVKNETEPTTLEFLSPHSFDYQKLVGRGEPQLYYRFNDLTASLGDLVRDNSNNNLTGIYQGQNNFAVEIDRIGGAANIDGNSATFDGLSGFISSTTPLPDTVLNKSTNPGSYSIELWFNSTRDRDSAFQAPQGLIDLADAGSLLPAVQLAVESDGRISFLHDALPEPGAEIEPCLTDCTDAEPTPPSATLISEFSYVPEQWHHLVAVNDGGLMKLYLDGIEDPNTFGLVDPITFATELSVGALQMSSVRDNFFDGSLDEVALYNKALDPMTIQRHFDAGQEFFFSNPGFEFFSGAELAADLDRDGDVDLDDLTLFCDNFNLKSPIEEADVDRDGDVDLDDLDLLLEGMDTIRGDLNETAGVFDGTVDIVDFGILAGFFGQPGPHTYLTADLNKDGVVDILDFAIQAANFGASAETAGILSPESGTLLLLGAGGVLMLIQRRRRV